MGDGLWRVSTQNILMFHVFAIDRLLRVIPNDTILGQEQATGCSESSPSRRRGPRLCFMNICLLWGPSAIS